MANDDDVSVTSNNDDDDVDDDNSRRWARCCIADCPCSWMMPAAAESVIEISSSEDDDWSEGFLKFVHIVYC